MTTADVCFIRTAIAYSSDALHSLRFLLRPGEPIGRPILPICGSRLHGGSGRTLFSALLGSLAHLLPGTLPIPVSFFFPPVICRLSLTPGLWGADEVDTVTPMRSALS